MLSREILTEQQTATTVLGGLGLVSRPPESVDFGLRFPLNADDFPVKFDGVTMEFRARHARPRAMGQDRAKRDGA